MSMSFAPAEKLFGRAPLGFIAVLMIAMQFSWTSIRSPGSGAPDVLIMERLQALEAQNSALAKRVEALESGNSNSKRTASVYAEEFSLMQTDVVKTSRKTKRLPSRNQTSLIAADPENPRVLLKVDRGARTALALQIFVPVLIAVLLALMALNMCGEKGEPCERKSATEPAAEQMIVTKPVEATEPVDGKGTEATELALEDLVDEMGVSGLCFLDLGTESPHGGYHLITVVTLACQSFFLQAVIMYFLFQSVLEPPSEADMIEDEAQPAGFFVMVYVAVYIHVDSLMRDIAVVLPKLAHAPSLQTSMWAKVFVCIVTAIDGILIPLATLFIGGLFVMDESHSPADLILNVVAITWIPTIDDEIFALNTKLDNMNGVNICEGESVNLPLHTGYLNFVKTTLGTIPVVPVVVSLAMLHLGTVMELA